MLWPLRSAKQKRSPALNSLPILQQIENAPSPVAGTERKALSVLRVNFRLVPKLFDLILEEQLSTLKLDQFQVIRPRVDPFRLNFLLECLVPALKFGEMGMQRHAYDSSAGNDEIVTQLRSRAKSSAD